jgi:hypothetical protein
MIEYRVVPGDNLTRIAARHGIRYWQNIYLAAENAELRAQRPNPDLIYPGDVIRIPAPDSIRPMERHPVQVFRNVPLFMQSSETCWRATAKMLFLRQFSSSTPAKFEQRIGDRYRALEAGLTAGFWTDFYVHRLGMTETVIGGPNDLHRILAERGPVIAAIGGQSAHSMVIAGYDVVRRRWLVLDPAAGEELTFEQGMTVVAGTNAAAAGPAPAAELARYATGSATWENMARWLAIGDTVVLSRIFHY